MLYDASHVAGLIAGGRFQDPLRDGVDVVTFSTYKSYGGPPGGAIVTRDPDVAERVFAAVYPGLTANFDAGRLRALGIAAAELLDHGAEYAARCIDAAQALGRSLHEAGLAVVGADRGCTDSHHLAVAVPDGMTGDSAVRRLEHGWDLRLRDRARRRERTPHRAAPRHPRAGTPRLRTRRHAGHREPDRSRSGRIPAEHRRRLACREMAAAATLASEFLNRDIERVA